MTSDTLPPVAIKKATNLVRDARQAAMAGLIPILGLIFILRLTQWYVLKKQYPALMSDDKEHAELCKEFRGALHRLWFAVLLWPCVIIFAIVYLSLS